MKILVVSLLRVGDVLMLAPALAELKTKYPGVKIDILVNRQCHSAAEMLPFIHQIFVFERDLYQISMKSADRNTLEAFFKLDALVQKLRSENYQMVFNFTHNRVSGYLCGAIEAENVVGLALDAQGTPKFGSPWFKYLNENAEVGQEGFHYVDVFRFSVGAVEGKPKPYSWKISESELEQAQNLLFNGESHLVVQPFSSETKKELSLANWRKLISNLRDSRHFDHIWVLGSPVERQRSQKIAEALSTQECAVESVILSLPGVAALLKKSQLLVTVDTSIKHLAAPLGIKVVELSLGSSDWRKTGIYSGKQLILQSNVDCAPCSHSSPCHQSEHFCANDFSSDLISQLIMAHVAEDETALEQIASQLAKKLSVYQTTFTYGGYWQTVTLGKSMTEQQLESWLNKLITKLLMQGESLEQIGQVGTEAMRFGQWLKEEFPEVNEGRWRKFFSEIEMRSSQIHEQSVKIKGQLSGLIANERGKPMSNIGELRGLQNKISDMDQRLEIHQRFTRTLNSLVGSVL